MLGQLVDTDYLLDFDIFHVSQVTELLHYVDGKYLTCELGGSNTGHVDTWISTQYHVDNFTVRHVSDLLQNIIQLIKVSPLQCDSNCKEVGGIYCCSQQRRCQPPQMPGSNNRGSHYPVAQLCPKATLIHANILFFTLSRLQRETERTTEN